MVREVGEIHVPYFYFIQGSGRQGVSWKYVGKLKDTESWGVISDENRDKPVQVQEKKFDMC